MKKIKQILSGFLSAVMIFSMSSVSFAAVGDNVFADVNGNAWYAEAVQYVNDNGIMSGTGNNEFSPQENTSRAALAAVLYRAEGSPAVDVQNEFVDVDSDAWYTDAVSWASTEGIISGYGNGLFGINDPVTREQIAAILWRYAGSPDAVSSENFADESSISSYAVKAVDWVRNNNIMSGKENNMFDPDGYATRAEIAMVLFHFMTLKEDNAQQDTEEDSNVLVVYFSATGSTQAVAQTIADTLEADIFEIEPSDPYTSEDLNWTDAESRVNAEHEDTSLRDVALVSDSVENWDSYDTVFIGYPIWWGIAAWPVSSFVAANDFAGKTVIPFCTSSSSGLGESGELLAELAGSGNWQQGQCFRSSADAEEVMEWVNSLDLNSSGNEADENQETRSLVVYFSMPETDDAENMTEEEDNSVVVMNGEVLGNTQYMANVIAEHTDSDIFRIEPETPYPTDHETLVDIASEEQEENARPAIDGNIGNLDDYDVIYVGYPIWWSDMPMVLYTFFDEYDLSGKTIVPFGTHGGSGFAGTIDAIAELEPNANVIEDGLTISRDDIEDAESDIIAWVENIGL